MHQENTIINLCALYNISLKFIKKKKILNYKAKQKKLWVKANNIHLWKTSKRKHPSNL